VLKFRLNRLGVSLILTTMTLLSCGSENAGEGEVAETGAVLVTVSASPLMSGEEQGDFWLGEPRDDLERFFGLYGDADHPGRDFLVVEAKRPKWAEQAPEIPPGYLMIGATWGDVAPWSMKAVSDNRFEQQSLGDFQPAEPIIVVFEATKGQNAVAITFETVFNDRGRLKRLGDVPEEWR
jgi:hypothetical protein